MGEGGKEEGPGPAWSRPAKAALALSFALLGIASAGLVVALARPEAKPPVTSVVTRKTVRVVPPQPSESKVPNAVVQVTFTNLSSQGQGSTEVEPRDWQLESRHWYFVDLEWSNWGSPTTTAIGYVSNAATADPDLVREPTRVILSDLEVCDGVPHYLSVRYIYERSWRTGSRDGCSVGP